MTRADVVGGARSLLPLALLTAVALGAPAPVGAADPLRQVGDERIIGKNRTGEECRLRLVEDRGDRQAFQRFALYCEGWTQPSGSVRRFRVAREATPERLVTDGAWQKVFSQRLGGCGAVEATTLASGAPSALRECKQIDGGWSVLVVATVIAGRAYGLESFPTNLPLLELAVEGLEGKRPLEGGGAPLLSAAIRRAETMVGASGRLVGIQDVGAHATLWRLARLQHYKGDDAEAEVSFGRVLEIEERAAGPDQPQSGNTLSWLALTISFQGRFAEADQIFARAGPLVERSFWEDDRARHREHRASTESRRGNPPGALRYAQEAVRSRETALRSRGVKELESGGLAHALTMLARAQLANGQLDEAEKAVSRAIGMVDKPGADPEFHVWWGGVARMDLGRIHLAQKRYADARHEFQLALDRYRLLFGDSARATEALTALGQAARLQGDGPAALQAFRQAAEIQTKDAAARRRARPDAVVAYLDALDGAARANPTERERLHAEAFVAAQLPSGGETARAITNMAARLDAADPAIRRVAREYQETLRRRDRVRQALAIEVLKLSERREPGQEEQLRQDLRAAEDKIANLETRLQAELPRYARLVAPRPLAVADLAGVLRPGEALLLILPTREATYVFLVRDNHVHLHRATVALADLERAVRDVRAGLEVQDDTLKPFDVATAHRLHQLLIAPVADRLQGVTHLITVPAGPLLALPIALLPTRPVTPPTDPLDYRATPWLVRDVAISVLPAVTSLRELRQVASASTASKPFLGYGDPAFAGAEGDTRGLAAMAALCRQDEPVDAALVRSLARLPETARELGQIARALGADPTSVVVGAQATEAAVRTADLSQYRVLAFATHGLLPGELRCKAEPALALTAPTTPSAADDGLLDAGEVAQLRLDADWVILSACNTAGPGGKLGGESLSGLAQAFFYAGARALLVSHWAVASRATVALTTGIFSAHAKTPTAGKAEALRQSQLTLAARPETSHPFFWAPFTLVGN